MNYIKTENFSKKLRQKIIKLDEKKILIARLSGSLQEEDISTPVNCDGYGRIRHFKLDRYNDWSINPLPILPAQKALGLTPETTLHSQVFQISGCNWRCWYCFVDNNRLSADFRVSQYMTAEELICHYITIEENNRPKVIDITGGQPDLAPEWLLWMMEAIEKYNLEGKIFLWSDDNLSSYYFWDFLNDNQIEFIKKFPKYSRVACFKGYNEKSFSYNTLAEPDLFNQQFEIYKKLLQEGLDMYAYVTFTALPEDEIAKKVANFVNKLQLIHPNLPLRTVPLKIEVFAPTNIRLNFNHKQALSFQYTVHSAWVNELRNRFSDAELKKPICDVSMKL